MQIRKGSVLAPAFKHVQTGMLPAKHAPTEKHTERTESSTAAEGSESVTFQTQPDPDFNPNEFPAAAGQHPGAEEDQGTHRARPTGAEVD